MKIGIYSEEDQMKILKENHQQEIENLERRWKNKLNMALSQNFSNNH